MKTLATVDQVRVIKALAHPARLAVAQALAVRERCVGDLQALVGGDLSTVSKHLSLMRSAGWIDCRKQGQQVYYRLACDCLPEFLRCVGKIAAGRSSDDCGC